MNKFFEPILFAFQQIKYFPFIQRTITIYKDPKFSDQSALIHKYEFIDLLISLSLSELSILIITQFFPQYFKFDPFKIIYFSRLALTLIISAFSLAASILLISSLFMILLKIQNKRFLIVHIFWRTCRVFSILLPFIIFMLLYLINNFFICGSMFCYNKGLLGFPLAIITLFIFTKLLIGPIYNLFRFKGKLISRMCIFFILLFSIILNETLTNFYSLSFINEKAYKEALQQSGSTSFRLK